MLPHAEVACACRRVNAPTPTAMTDDELGLFESKLPPALPYEVHSLALDNPLATDNEARKRVADRLRRRGQYPLFLDYVSRCDPHAETVHYLLVSRRPFGWWAELRAGLRFRPFGYRRCS